MNIKKNILACAAAILLSVSLFAEYETVLAISYTAYPDQIVCTPHGDLKTQVGLAWVTGRTGSAAKAQVMPKDGGDNWDNAVNYTGDAGDVDEWRWHKVTVTGLRPDTTYKYRVGDGNIWSETCEFTTAPDTLDEPFTFLQVNDTQASNLQGFQAGQKALEKAAERFSDYKFVSHGGDTVSSGGNENEWQMYFDTTKNVLRKTVYAGVMGNHEKENYNGVTTTPRYPYRFNYKFPDYASTDEGLYYSFDYGNAHFTVLHGKAFRDTKQTDWLKYDLAKNSKKWNIVLIHQPLYSNGSHATEDNILKARAVFAPILNDQFNVDMIFQAHEHTYSRTYPIRDSKPLTDTPLLTNQTVGNLTGVTLWNNPKGTVHQLNNACGLKYYTLNEQAETKWFVPVNGSLCFQPHKPTYAGVTVTDNEIVNSAYYVDGDREMLIENQGIRKTTPPINPPRNVKKTYSSGSLTITWDAPEAQIDQAVQQYVIYDENNTFTTKNATYFVSANKLKSLTIPISEAVYNNTNFVVKAIGQHSVSSVGFTDIATDPANPKTSIWIKSAYNSSSQKYTNLNSGISPGSYATIINNKDTSVTAVCILTAYDTDNRMIEFRNLGNLNIDAVSEAKIALPVIDPQKIKQLKISAYIDSIDPLKPGGMPLILNKTN